MIAGQKAALAKQTRQSQIVMLRSMKNETQNLLLLFLHPLEGNHFLSVLEDEPSLSHMPVYSKKQNLQVVSLNNQQRRFSRTGLLL